MLPSVRIFILLLATVIAAAPAGRAQDATQPAASPAAQASEPTKTWQGIRIDPAHPPKIGVKYYPVVSRMRNEQGICIMHMLVVPDGTIAAFQLVSSTGFPLLDAACWNSIVNIKFLPASLNGIPVTAWGDLPIIWHIKGYHSPMSTHDRRETPHFDDTHILQAGPDFYPRQLRQSLQLGTCLVHALVSDQGIASNIAVRKSTGFATLDQACVEAIQNSRFVPAVVHGNAVARETDVAMAWRSP